MPEDVSALQAEIEACRICVEKPLKDSLPHEPRPVVRLSKTARLCIAGQAPGLRVHESGEPFDDASGDRLREWMGVDRDTFYDRSRLAIVPMSFCFPGYDKNKSDLPPRKECRLAWHDRIFAAMPQVELVLTIGLYAQAHHMGAERSCSMTETVRNWRQHFQRNIAPKVLPLPHPSWRNTSWLRKNPWFEEEVLPVLRKETQCLLAK